MTLGQSNILGLAFSDRGVTCVEVPARGGGTRRAKAFLFPPGLSVDAAETFGPALAGFLKQNQFTARRAVVGVPARWLIAVERDVPPVGADQARAALRLQVERMGASDGNELVFDHAGELPGARAGGKILLVGMMKNRLRQIERAIKSAGLTLVGVTSTALALASADVDASPETSLLIVGAGGAEVVWRHGGSVRQLRHLSPASTTGGTRQIGAELRRAVAMAQAPLTNGDAGASRELLVWNESGLTDAETADLSGQAGMPVRLQQADEFAPAAALATLAARHALPVNLLYSRLAPKPARRVGRRGAWAIALGATLMLVLAVLYVDLLQRQAEADDLQANLAKLAPDVKSAENLLARFNYAKGFFETRPPVLDALLEVSRTFRDDEAIWITSVGLRETNAGQLQGKSRDQRLVLNVLDRMKKSPKFTDVKLLDMRDAGGKDREAAFSISFTFKPG